MQTDILEINRVLQYKYTGCCRIRPADLDFVQYPHNLKKPGRQMSTRPMLF